MADKENRLTTLWREIKEYFELNVEYAKLTAAEKLAVLMTAAAIAAISGVMALIVLFFISIAAVHWLSLCMSLALAYTIMAAFNLLILALILLFREKLIVDPISKFISRLILR